MPTQRKSKSKSTTRKRATTQQDITRIRGRIDHVDRELHALVAREDIVEAFFIKKHFQRFPQAVKQIGRRGIREIAVLVRREHFVPGPVGTRQLRVFAGSEGFG